MQAGCIAAVAGMNREADMLYITELLGEGQLPAPTTLSSTLAWDLA